MKTLGVLTVLAVLGALESSFALNLGKSAGLGAAAGFDPSTGCVDIENSSSQGSESHSRDSDGDETSEYTPTENGGTYTEKKYNREKTVDGKSKSTQSDKRNLCVSKDQGVTSNHQQTRTAEEQTRTNEKYHEEGSTDSHSETDDGNDHSRSSYEKDTTHENVHNKRTEETQSDSMQLGPGGFGSRKGPSSKKTYESEQNRDTEENRYEGEEEHRHGGSVKKRKYEGQDASASEDETKSETSSYNSGDSSDGEDSVPPVYRHEHHSFHSNIRSEDINGDKSSSGSATIEDGSNVRSFKFDSADPSTADDENAINEIFGSSGGLNGMFGRRKRDTRNTQYSNGNSHNQEFRTSGSQQNAANGNFKSSESQQYGAKENYRSGGGQNYHVQGHQSGQESYQSNNVNYQSTQGQAQKSQSPGNYGQGSSRPNNYQTRNTYQSSGQGNNNYGQGSAQASSQAYAQAGQRNQGGQRSYQYGGNQRYQQTGAGSYQNPQSNGRVQQRYGSNQSYRAGGNYQASQSYNGRQQSQAYAQASSNGQASHSGRYQNGQRNYLSRRGNYQTQGGYRSGGNYQTRQLNYNSGRNNYQAGQGYYRYGQGNNRFANRRRYTQAGKQSVQDNRSGYRYHQSGNQYYQNRGSNQSRRRYQSAVRNRVGNAQRRNGYHQINRRYNQNANHKDVLGYLKQHGYHRSGYTGYNRYGNNKYYGFNKGHPVNKNPHATEYRHNDVKEYLKGYGTYNPAVANNHRNVQYVKKNTGIIDNTPFFTGNGRYVLIPGQNGNSHRYYDTVSKKYLTVKTITITDSNKVIIIPGNYAGNAGKGDAKPEAPGYTEQEYDCGYDVYYLGNGSYKYKDQTIPADKIDEFTKSKGLNIPFTDTGLPLGRFHSIFGGNHPVNLGSGLFYLNNGSYKYKDQTIQADKIIAFMKSAGISNVPITKEGYPEELIKGASPIPIGSGVEFLGHNLYRHNDQIVPSSQIKEYTKKLGYTIPFTSNGLPSDLVDGTCSKTTNETTSTVTSSPTPNNSGSRTTTATPVGPNKPVSSSTTATPLIPDISGSSPDNSGPSVHGYDCGNDVYYIGNDTYEYKDKKIPADKIATFIKEEGFDIPVTDKGLPLGPFYGIFGGDNFPIELVNGVFYLGNGNYKCDDETIPADKIAEVFESKGINNISLTKDGYPNDLWSGDAPIELDGGFEFLSHNHYQYKDKIIPSTKIVDVTKSLNVDIPFTSNGLPLELVNETINHVLNPDAAEPTGIDQGYDCGNGIYYFSNGTYRYNDETYTPDKIGELTKSKGFEVPATDDGLPLGPFYSVFGGNDYPIDLGNNISYIGDGNYKCDDEIIPADKMTTFVKDKGISNMPLKDGFPEVLWSGEDAINLGGGLSFLGHDLYEYEDHVIPSSKIVEFSKNFDFTVPFTSDGLPLDLINETLIHATNPDASIPITPGNSVSDGKGYDCGNGIYYISHGTYKYNDQIIPADEIGDFCKSKGFTFPVTDDGLPLGPFYDVFGNFPVNLGQDLYYLDDGNYKFDDEIISADKVGEVLKEKDIKNMKLTKNGYPEDLCNEGSPVEIADGLQFLGYNLYKCDDEIIPSSKIVEFCKKSGFTVPFTTNGLPLDLVEESLESVLGTLGSGEDNAVPLGDNDFPISLGQDILFNGKDEYKYQDHVVPASKMPGLMKILGLNLTLPTDLKAPTNEIPKGNDSGETGSKHIYCGYNIYYLGDGKYSYEDHVIPASYMPGLLKILGVHMKLPSDGDDNAGAADRDNKDCDENTKKGDTTGDKNGTRRCDDGKGTSSKDSSKPSDDSDKSKPKNKKNTPEDTDDGSKPKAKEQSDDDCDDESKPKHQKKPDDDKDDRSKHKPQKKPDDDNDDGSKSKHEKKSDYDKDDRSKSKNEKKSDYDKDNRSKPKHQKKPDDDCDDESKSKHQKIIVDDKSKSKHKETSDDDKSDRSKSKNEKKSDYDKDNRSKPKHQKKPDDDCDDESKSKQQKIIVDDKSKSKHKETSDDDKSDRSKSKNEKRSDYDKDDRSKPKHQKKPDDDCDDESKSKHQKIIVDDKSKSKHKETSDDDKYDRSKSRLEKKSDYDKDDRSKSKHVKKSDDDCDDESKSKHQKIIVDDKSKSKHKETSDDDKYDRSKFKNEKRSDYDKDDRSKPKHQKKPDDDCDDESKSKHLKIIVDDKSKSKHKETSDDDKYDRSKSRLEKKPDDDCDDESKSKDKNHSESKDSKKKYTSKKSIEGSEDDSSNGTKNSSSEHSNGKSNSKHRSSGDASDTSEYYLKQSSEKIKSSSDNLGSEESSSKSSDASKTSGTEGSPSSNIIGSSSDDSSGSSSDDSSSSSYNSSYSEESSHTNKSSSSSSDDDGSSSQLSVTDIPIPSETSNYETEYHQQESSSSSRQYQSSTSEQEESSDSYQEES